MTYTFKLARRLAVSREFAMLAGLALIAACMGDTTTGPESATLPSHDLVPFRVLPGTVTVETNQPITFHGESNSADGSVFRTRVSWEVSGGTIDGNGTFTASAAGTYKVVGRGRGRSRPDTSIVVVVPTQPTLTDVSVLPDPANLAPAASHAFTATGLLSDGTEAPIGVTWSASGGTIDEAGLYTAGAVPGSFRVVAYNPSSALADTATVVIVESEPAPPPPAPTLEAVVLRPASVSLASGATQRFRAYGTNSLGDSVAVSVTFSATGGSIGADGLFTAGGAAGDFRVIATAGSLSDTSKVTVTTTATTTTGTGVPFGIFNVTPSGLTSPLNLAVFAGNPDYLMAQLATAKKNGTKIIVNFAGGNYSNNFGPDGYFSYDVWKARTDRFKSLDLAPYIADGTLFANYLIDEPHNSNSWGGRPVPHETLEQMAKYSKSLWPGLKTIIRTRVSWLDDATFKWVYLDAGWAQYGVGKGDVYVYRDTELAAAKASGLAVLFGLNTTNGGAIVDGCYPGSRAGLCAMTAAEIKRYGTLLASETGGCGLTLWQHDDVYLSRSDIRSALTEVARVAASRASRPCT